MILNTILMVNKFRLNETALNYTILPSCNLSTMFLSHVYYLSFACISNSVHGFRCVESHVSISPLQVNVQFGTPSGIWDIVL
jgi:hypothetical protein